MDKQYHFSRGNVEKTHNQFITPQKGRMARGNNDVVFDPRYSKSLVPPTGRFPKRNVYPDDPAMYKSHASHEMLQQYMPNNTAGYTNNYDQTKRLQGQEYSPSHYHSNNRQLENNLSDEEQAFEYCNRRNSTRYGKTDPYFSSKNYQTDEHLTQKTMHYHDGTSQNSRGYRDVDASRMGPRFGEFNTRRSTDDPRHQTDEHLTQKTMHYHDGTYQNSRGYRDVDASRMGPRFGEFNTQRSTDDPRHQTDEHLTQKTMHYHDGTSQNSRGYRDVDASRMDPRFGEFNTRRSTDDPRHSYSHRHDELTRSKDFPTKLNDFDRNLKRNRMEINGEHHLQSSTMSMQPIPVSSYERSNSYSRPSKSKEEVSRYRTHLREIKPIQKLDDGFVCVRNPDFFSDSHGDKKHVSKHTRNVEHKSHPEFENKQKQSQDLSLTIDETNNNLKKGNAKQWERVKKFKESIKVKREFEKINKAAGVTLTKPIKNHVIQTPEEDISFKKYHWQKGDNTINPKKLSQANEKLHKKQEKMLRKAKYTFIKKQTSGANPKESTTSGVTKNKASEEVSKELRVLTKKERQKIYVKIRVQKNISIARSYQKQARMRRQKARELKAAGLLGEPCEGHIKYDPEKYWSVWWSKYAYVEKAIGKIDAVSMADRLNFRSDINDLSFDSGINDIYHLALAQIETTSTLTELNYERRTDAFLTLKYLKTFEDKEFQSFLTGRQARLIEIVLKEERENKKRQALLYQSIICSWHYANLPREPDDTALEIQKRIQARSLQKYELYPYMVLDSIKELKKLTAEDWPGFEEFYQTLK